MKKERGQRIAAPDAYFDLALALAFGLGFAFGLAISPAFLRFAIWALLGFALGISLLSLAISAMA
jgi:hypothetical protein